MGHKGFGGTLYPNTCTIVGMDVCSPDEVADAFAEANVAMARAHALLARLSEEAVAAVDGSVSRVAWLRSRVGLSAGEAARAVRLARLVGVAPALATAWQEGKLSSGQVAAIRANVDEATQALFVAQEGELVPTLVPLSVRDTALAMQHWKAMADALVDRPEPAEPALGSLRLRVTLDGTWLLDGRLSAEAGAVVDEALSVAMQRADGPWDRPGTVAERRAEALVAVADRFLRDAPARVRRRRPHLHVLLDAQTLLEGGRARLVGGATLSSSATARLVCDADWYRVLLGPEGEVLDHGRAHRLVPAGLWGAVALRDQGCRHPGCDRPEAWCDAHHVVPFPTGPTSLTNVVLLCRRHHTLVHQPGWTQHLARDGTYTVTDPRGASHTSRPPPLSCVR